MTSPGARRRAMIAIESCRTFAALGGHVRERCSACGHQRIAYDSGSAAVIENWLGQGLARAQWIADRQAELLDVLYFHVVFTVARSGDRGYRVPEPDSGLRHPVPGGVGDAAHHCRRSIWEQRSASSVYCTRGDKTYYRTLTHDTWYYQFAFFSEIRNCSSAVPLAVSLPGYGGGDQ